MKTSGIELSTPNSNISEIIREENEMKKSCTAVNGIISTSCTWLSKYMTYNAYAIAHIITNPSPNQLIRSISERERKAIPIIAKHTAIHNK